jgi:hypothetical protein
MFARPSASLALNGSQRAKSEIPDPADQDNRLVIG